MERGRPTRRSSKSGCGEESGELASGQAGVGCELTAPPVSCSLSNRAAGQGADRCLGTDTGWLSQGAGEGRKGGLHGSWQGGCYTRYC